MPDIERVTDSLRMHLATLMRDSHARQWAAGYAAGKRRARIEAAIIVVALCAGIALFGRFVGGGKP